MSPGSDTLTPLNLSADLLIQFKQLTLVRGLKILIQGATLQLHPGHKVGLTGANGAGKSSLFALLRGEMQLEAGDLEMPASWVIAHVAQETPALAMPAIEFVLDGDAELRQIEVSKNQLETLRKSQEGLIINRADMIEEANDARSQAPAGKGKSPLGKSAGGTTELGFKVKDEEDNSDYTFNKPSGKEGWIDLLVWHPETNNVCLLYTSDAADE